MAARSLGTLLGALALTVLSVAGAAAQSSGPVTEPDRIELDEDTVVVAYPLLNDADPGGGTLQLLSIQATPVGATRIDGSAVVFTPNPDWNGVAELIYTVATPSGEATGVMTFTVNGVNDAPVANDDIASTRGTEPVAIDVLANDTDVDGDVLVLGTVNSPVHGSVAMSDGMLEYTAPDGFSGDDTFAYRVFDPAGEAAEAAVTVSVSPAIAGGVAATPTSQPTVPAGAPENDLVAGPQWAAPPVAVAGGAESGGGFVASLVSHLETLLLPLLLLGLVGVTAWIMSQREGVPGRKHAVVLVARGESLAVHEKATRDSKVVYRFGHSSRRIDVVGRRRLLDGVEWLPVSTPAGRGWVESQYLTEDVARATFEADLVERDIIRELRRKLKGGAPISTSSRGVIDPEGFGRDRERRQLGGNATAHLAALLDDWRASFYVDRTASLTALRPPQLRNLHWVSLEAPGLDPWQLFFEYSDGHPYPVAALAENVVVPV